MRILGNAAMGRNADRLIAIRSTCFAGAGEISNLPTT
jgi:hypothetical protein